ncbi:MAG: phosphonate C-P lyase system protein PhnK [Alphaproteobacteria bacterium]
MTGPCGAGPAEPAPGDDIPLLEAIGLHHRYGPLTACRDVSLDLFQGEVIGIVGESGSGKTTLLRCLAGHLAPTGGTVLFREGNAKPTDLHALEEGERRRLRREVFGFVHQTPRDGLRSSVSAGANIVEPLMNLGARHYERLRETALDWMDRVELDRRRIDDPPSSFSGGMQQRVQIARSLVHAPRIVFMDEPTGGLDVSVQARLLDTLRRLVRTLSLSAIIVTHDLRVARLLADRLMVMKDGCIVEKGITDQVLDDPEHAYTQLLVSAVPT